MEGARLPLAALIGVGLGSIRLDANSLRWIDLGWHQGPGKFILGRGRIADNLPAKRPAELPQGVRIPIAENNEAIRLESDNEVIAVAPHRHLPPIFHEVVPVSGIERGGARIVPCGDGTAR